MDMVDDQQARGEEDRKCSSMGRTSECWRGRLNEALEVSMYP